MKSLLYGLFLLFLLLPSNLKAENSHEQTVHDVAHFGMGYALTMFGTGFYEKVFRMDKTTAFIFGAGLSTMILLFYKESEGPGVQIGRSLLYHETGVVGAGLTFKMFSF